MSFNVGSSSGTLSFRPARFNVDWDGVSQANATFALTCWDTAASYSAVAYRVFDADKTETIGGVEFSVRRGERFYSLNPQTGSQTFATDVQLSVAAANGAAQVTFSSLPPYAHAWYLKATKSNVPRVLIAGLVRVVELNPYEPGAGSVQAVSGVTASGCF